MRTIILLLALLPVIASAQKASKGSLRDSALVVTNEQDAAALAAFAGATNTLHAAITNEALYRAQADAAALAATHSATGALAQVQAATNAAVSIRITVSHTNLLEHFTAVLLAESYARGTNVTAWADFILSDTRASNALNRAQTAAAIGALIPYTGATGDVDIGTHSLTAGDVTVQNDLAVGGHAEIDGRIDLLGSGRYISGLAPLDSGTWPTSTRAVSGEFLYGTVRGAVDEAVFISGYRTAPIEERTNDWNAAYGWGDHAAAGYATRAEISAIVMSNSVSQMVVWTNSTGAATNMAWRENGTWYTNPIGGASADLPDGVVTNGMGGLLLATNATGEGFVRISGSGGGWNAALEVNGNMYLSNWESSRIRFPDGSFVSSGTFYGNAQEMGFKAWLGDAERWVIRSHNGNAYIDNGNLTVSGTNTAAAFYQSAPDAWIAATNLSSQSVTLTNLYERPHYLYATGDVSLAFESLRQLQPLKLVVFGPDSLTFPSNTHFVGGAFWQTNQYNMFFVSAAGTNIMVTPYTTWR